MTTGSDLKERVQVQSLLYYPEANVYAWEVKRNTWAKAEQDTRKNLFSSAGIGARGVTFTLRRNPELTIVNSSSGGAVLFPHLHCGRRPRLPGSEGGAVRPGGLHQGRGHGNPGLPLPRHPDGEVCGP